MGSASLPPPADGHLAEFGSIPKIIQAARQRLSPVLWDIAAGAAGTETVPRRNRMAMEEFTFKPRILRGVTQPDLTTSAFGRTLASPVLLAPIGSISLFDPDGAVAQAKVADQHNILGLIGLLATPGLDEVAQAGRANVLQIYVRGDRKWLTEIVRAAEESGYVGLCLTVDSIGGSSREREVHNRFTRRIPRSPNLPIADSTGVDYQRSFTWHDFAWLRSITDLPLAIKGILLPEDAIVAVEHGADVIYVSNHGGRELDHLPATLTSLPAIADAVGERAEILIDGGFLRGTDVVKALALGATAVLLGRLQIFCLAAGGAPLLKHALELIDAEILETLCLLGVPGVSALSAEHVQSALPVGYRPSYLTEYMATGIPTC